MLKYSVKHFLGESLGRNNRGSVEEEMGETKEETSIETSSKVCKQ